jgi:hypothetical protein
MRPETATLITEWISAHSQIFSGLRWPDPAADSTGFYAHLRDRIAASGFVSGAAADGSALREITRDCFEGEQTLNLQDHIKQIFYVGRAVLARRGMIPSAANPNAGRDTAENDVFLARAAKVRAWFDHLDDVRKERWRAAATEGLPAVRTNPYCDDFVCGYITSHYPGFEGED